MNTRRGRCLRRDRAVRQAATGGWRRRAAWTAAGLRRTARQSRAPAARRGRGGRVRAWRDLSANRRRDQSRKDGGVLIRVEAVAPKNRFANAFANAFSGNY